MGFCYQKNFSNPTLPVDEARFWALVRAGKWNENIDQYRKTGDAALKRKLPAFIFQATFDETTSKAGKKGAWRKQAATRLTGLVVMDVDHIEDPRGVFVKWNGESLRDWGIVLIYITPSGKGLKIVFKARLEWGNLIDNQHQMAQLLGVEVDESCKDASRMSFVCKESDILYLDKELFTYENQAFSERYTALYRDGHSQATRDHSATEIRTDSATEKVLKSCSPLQEEFNGMPVSEIIDKWMQGVNLANNRHNTLVDLASHLRYVIGKNPTRITEAVMTLPWVQDLANEGEDVVGTVRSVMDFKYHEHMPKKLREAVATTSQLENDNMAQQLWTWGEEIEALSDDFPILRDVCKGLKRNQYASALFVSGGFMMTLMTRCRYRFYHRPEELRRLNCEVMVIGDPASGKSFATRLYKLLIAPIIAADRIGKDAINAYREQMKTKGANKEKPKKPKVVVRVHPARTSNAQFIQDMVNAVEEVDGEPMQLHMLTFDTELDNTLSIQKGGSWIDKQSLELKAFHNEEDGQAYSNMDSVIENFCVTWNFIYTGTPLALKAKINERNFGSGLATRLTCIPLPPTNFEMMSRESVVDCESDKRLKEWGEKLDRMKGVLSVEKIVDELYDWTARRMADAKENNSKAEEMLLKRCAYHGLNFAAPFIVMRHWDQMHHDGAYYCGEFETDEVDWKLVELIVNIQYACQRHYFLAMAEKYFDDQMRDYAANVRHSSKVVECFNRLPDEFSVEDMMQCFSIAKANVARARISRLVKDHYAEKVGDYVENGTTKAVYQKTGKAMC
ncbi:BT4734/BF3469 family protein [Prevotella sp. P6B4]|uniref:BT4734/BF3469 family protein n=1 Tax=Prevotella sp. P6B4 TaxID=1410614 RepID=UPI00048AE4AC|nr:BT4734/BF3469 family protein [Prevotella sp. P6B4]